MTTRCLLLFAWLLTACSGETEKTPPQAASASPAKAKAVAAAPITPPATPAAVVQTFRGGGTVDGSGDKGMIELFLDDAAHLQGKLVIAQQELRLSGAVVEGVARAWADQAATDPAASRRGFIVGEVQGKRVNGSFAFSGSGGANAVRGSFSATAQ